MPEKKFNEWNKLKNELHTHDVYFYYREGEVWFCSIGANIGWEQDGKHELFERPVIVIKKLRLSLFLGVPCSSSVKRGQYFFEITHAGKIFTALLLQVCVFDARRLQRKLYVVEHNQFLGIVITLCSMIKTSAPPFSGASEQIGDTEIPFD